MYDFQEQTVYAVFVLIFLKTLYRAANIFFLLKGHMSHYDTISVGQAKFYLDITITMYIMPITSPYSQ